MEQTQQMLRYWLAWNASDWVYKKHDERGDEAEWVMDCGDGVKYTAKANLRRSAGSTDALQFSAFDVEVTGGALPPGRPWKVYVLAFRGSVTLQDWAANLSAPINVDSQLADLRVGVHAGWHAYVSDRTLQQDLKAAIAGIESDEILLAGHSLGGALAQIVLLWLWREHQTNGSPLQNEEHIANRTNCITFGSPAPFMEMEMPRNNALAEQEHWQARTWMEEKCVNFINNNDPVPRLPFDLSFFLNLASFGLLQCYEWRLSSNNLTQQLKQYKHFCSHIMLNRGEVTFELLEPMAEALGQRGPLVWKNEHDVQKYKDNMFPKLLGEINTATRLLRQAVRYRPWGNAPDLADILGELPDTLESELPDTLFTTPYDHRECGWRPFGTAFLSAQSICTQMREIEVVMKCLSRQADAARSLHEQVGVQLNAVKSYIEAANNSILAETWEDVS